MFKRFLFILLSSLVVSTSANALPVYSRGGNCLTGGTPGCLDSYDGATLNDSDVAFIVTGGSLYVYALDADSALAESSPDVIAPDTAPKDRRWILQTVSTTTLDATLQSIALLGTAADKGLYTTGVDTWAEFAFTSVGRDILDDASTADQRTTLGLTIGTNVQSWDPQIDDIAALAFTDGNIIVGDGSNWVAESGNTARTSLGLGTGNSPGFVTVVHSGNASFTGSAGYLLTNSTDGSDNKAIAITGAGGIGSTRGSLIITYGNEHASNPGDVKLVAGDTGDILITGNVGIGVTDPDTTLEVFKAGTQLKLSFDATDNTTFAVDTSGVLTITPSGSVTNIAGSVGITNGNELRLYEPSGGGTSYTGFESPALAGNVIYVLPAADGGDGQVLKTNGSGTLAWVDASGAGASSDHGALTGLADDDHAQYLLTTGGRAVTGAQTFNNAVRIKGDPWCDVKAYGATGDGSTDDTAAIQAAINAAEAGSKIVYLPAGTYRVTADLTIDTVNTTVRGAGRSSTIISVKIADAGGFTNGILYLNSGEPSATIEDLTIQFEQPSYYSTADATEANKLHDADGGFFAGMVGRTVYNVTDNTSTTISAYVDSGELTLTADIFVSGETYSISMVIGDLTAYVPAIHAVAEPRFKINRVRIIGAYDGIDMTGNSGGATIRDLEMSMFHVGIEIDGSYDTVIISGLRTYPFSLSLSQMTAMMAITNTGLKVTRMDNLIVSDSMITAGIACNFIASGTDYDSWAQFTNSNFESYSEIYIAGLHRIYFTNCWFSTGIVSSGVPNTHRKFYITGGQTHISNSRFYTDIAAPHATPAYPFIDIVADNTGSQTIQVVNSRFDSQGWDIEHIRATATGAGYFATVKIDNNYFYRTPSGSYSSPIIEFNGVTSGVIRGNISNNSTRDMGGGSGAFVDIDVDDYITILGNNAMGRAYTLPGGYSIMKPATITDMNN